MMRLSSFSLGLALWLAVSTAFAADSNSKPAEPSSFQVSNKKYSDLLRPQDANGATGTRIVLYPGQPWKCMTWKFHPAGEGAFYLQNHFTSKTFSIDTKAEKTPPPVTQVPYAKATAERPVWQFTKLPDGTYKITDSKSGKALTAVKEGSGLKVVAEDWQDKDEQKWKLNPIDPKDLTM